MELNMGFAALLLLTCSTLLEITRAASCQIVSSPNTTCVVQGRLRTTNHDAENEQFEPTVVSSIEECALLCSRRVLNKRQRQNRSPGYYCDSFDYDRDTGFCQLSTHPILEKHILSDGNHTFVSHKCLDCPDICDQPLGAQLLDNGDFENQGFTIGPWRSHTEGGKVFKGHDSEHAFGCVYPKKQGHELGCNIEQQINTCYGQLYAISFWYNERPNAFSNYQGFIAGLGDSVYDYGSAAPFAAFDQSVYFGIYRKLANLSAKAPWRQVMLFYRKAAKVNFYFADPFGFSFEDNGFVVDDVKIARMDSNIEAQPGAKELIANGGFETGDFSSFVVTQDEGTGDPEVVSPGINSKYAMKYAAAAYTGYVTLSQTLNTVAGTVYLFSMDVRLTMTKKNGSVVLNIQLGAGDSYVESDQSYPTGNYTLRIPLFAQNETTEFYLILGDFYGESGTLLVDNLSLKKLANPPTG